MARDSETGETVPDDDEEEERRQRRQLARQDDDDDDDDDDDEDVEEQKDDQEAGAYINQGLLRWESSRASWLRSADGGSDSTPAKAAVPLDVDEIIDVIFSQRWRNSAEQDGTDDSNSKSSFPQPVPLPQMVDILVDLWEAEGLDT